MTNLKFDNICKLLIKKNFYFVTITIVYLYNTLTTHKTFNRVSFFTLIKFQKPKQFFYFQKMYTLKNNLPKIYS